MEPLSYQQFLSIKDVVDLVVRRDLLVMLVSLVLLVDPDLSDLKDLKAQQDLLELLAKRDLRLVLNG